MAKLVCQAGPNAGHEYSLNRDKMLFGRQRTCDVQIMDSMASREHFLIRRDGNLYTLVDLESRNGTHLNERKVNERQLEFGDVIRIGVVEYLFVKEDGDADLKDLLTKKYTIQEKIGEGGMGIVYKALQKSMERTVALKILAPKYSNRTRFVEQFIREARAAGALNHPNIIQVHDVASENGVHYFSMEFIDGPTAMRMLSTQGQLPPAVALEIIRQTAKALAYAHEHRIIHRDIKPDNIMVTTNNTVKLADLGISKTFDEVEAEGKAKRIVGTPHYMAPEASLGERIDHRVDIYSLGVTLYHLLSGRTPYSGSKATEVLKAHIRDTPEPLTKLVPGLHPDIAAFVDWLMAKKPADRPQEADAIAERAQQLLESTVHEGPANKGEETVMLRRVVSATANEAPERLPSNPTTGSRDISQQRTRTREPTATNQRQRSSLRPLISLVLLAVGVVIAIYIFSQMKEAFEDGGDAANTRTEQQPPATSSGDASHSPSPPLANNDSSQDTSADRIAQVQALGDRLAAARSPAELASVLEEARLLKRAASHADLVTRLSAIEDAASQRIEGALVSRERSEFTRLERDIETLLQSNDYEGAQRRLASFEPQYDQRLADSKSRLEQRIQEEQSRFLAALERRVDRLATTRDVAGLRELRDELPASLLEHPTVVRLGDIIRDLESRQLEQYGTIREEALRMLLGMQLDSLSLHIRQMKDRHRSEQLNLQLNDIEVIVPHLQTSLKALNDHLGSLDRYPRYRGTLRGLSNPDLTGAATNGMLLTVASGGQATVPWRDMNPEILPEVISLAIGDGHPQGDMVRRTFQTWLTLVAAVR